MKTTEQKYADARILCHYFHITLVEALGELEAEDWDYYSALYNVRAQYKRR